MIYLIGGSARTGKTTLAKKLSEKLEIPWISIDSLRSVIQPYISSKKQLPFDQIWSDQNNDELFEKYSKEELIQVSEKEALTLWPGVKNFIKHNILISQDYIIEGEQLLPKLVIKLKEASYWENIKTVFLVHLNEEKTLSAIKKKHKEHDWLIKHSKKEETLDKAANFICEVGKLTKENANKYNFNSMVMDNDFSTQMKKAVNTIKSE
ncbi:MAG: hypothetical protein HQ538_00935 [Parcubacteria group bacterium]|nr:hypothetical protein [Parcubacteria group bacterium]